MLQRLRRGVEMMNSPPYRCHSFPFCDKKYQIPYDLNDMMSLITSKNIIVSHSRCYRKGWGTFLCIPLDLISLFIFLAFVCPLKLYKFSVCYDQFVLSLLPYINIVALVHTRQLVLHIDVYV
jgi:hypothetical protein